MRPDRLLKDESDTFEAKEAGFANAGAGYLVFGVKDETLEVVGLPNDRFTAAELTPRFDHYLAPAIQWDRTTFEIAGKRLGVIYVYSASRKPDVSRVERRTACGTGPSTTGMSERPLRSVQPNSARSWAREIAAWERT
jgi:predicted HTH transcriptional regulator